MDEISVWVRLWEAAAAIGYYWLALLIGGSLASAYAMTAHPRKRWPDSRLAAWLERPATKVGIVAVIIFCSFFYAWFMAFDSVNVANHRLRADIDHLKKPEFSLEVNSAIIGDDRPGSIHLLLFSMLANSGAPAAIVPSSWKLVAHLPNKREFYGDPTTIVAPEPYCLDSKRHLTFERSDQLSLRASEQIDRMGFKDGILSFVIKGMSVPEMHISTIEISMEDIVHKQYSFRFSIPDIEGKNIGWIYRPNYSHPLPEDGCPNAKQ